jgi:LacI family transcriptional regulator
LQGAKEAVTHLIETGRQRIGLVNGPPTTTSSAAKYEGFRLAQSLHDLAFVPSRVVASEEFATEPGYRQTLRLLEQAPDLDAIVYAGDRMAVGGLRAIKESGRRVPEDVAITGFYDDEIARFADPPLTSVYVDMHMVGRIAARRLCMLLEEADDEAWCVTVPASLVVRESTARGSS